MSDSAPASFRILIVEDDREYAQLIGVLLAERESGDPFPDVDIAYADRLSAARARLAHRDVGLILLDLTLPDSQGLATLTDLAAEYPEVPIVVVTSLADQATAVRALQCGAQDYLIKSELDRRLLLKSMRYSLERHRLQEQLRSLSLTDSLTGLSNRRGFITFAERQLKVLRRRSEGAIVLLLLDVDGLKTINDRYGHAEGDRALVRVGAALRASFREADILARLGGDEFAVVALDLAGDAIETLLARLQVQLALFNGRPEQPYLLRVSAGWARVETDAPASLDSLLAEADERLYRAKASRPAGDIAKSIPSPAQAATSNVSGASEVASNVTSITQTIS